MASQSLYRKWRSQKFDEMVGQEPIVDTLRNALTNNNLKHAYLFAGPRGTGKTTTARLLAKTVNCSNPSNGEPCNECQQCREITAGTSFNVIEIDAASNRGIDSIRELREKVMMPPSTGKYKVYILDEAHMLTAEASNALLKTLEEPPDYAIFVLATTDAHKVLPTVISRCQDFYFKRFSTRQIISHLLFVAKEEQINIEQSAAALIARTAAGGMRDALSLLDQAMAYADGEISLAQVQSMLGVADPRAISKLVTYIAELNSPALLYLIHELAEAGADLRHLNAQVVEYWRALMLAKAGADVATILDLTEEEVNEVQQLVPTFVLEELTECARIFAQNDLVQKSQGTPQLGLELASLECIELHRRVQAGQPVARPDNLAPASALVQPSAALPVAHPATPASPGMPPASLKHDTPYIETPVSGRSSEDTSDRIQRPERVVTPAETNAPAPGAQGQPGLTLEEVQASWENVKKRAKQKSGLLAAYLQHFQVVSVEEAPEGTAILIQAANQRHFDSIRDRPKDIEWAFSTEFNRPCKVHLAPPGKGAQRSSYSVNIASSQQSAYREPLYQAGQKMAGEDSSDGARPGQDGQSGLSPLSTNQVARVPGISDTHEPGPLARTQGVRENKKVVLSKVELGQKAQQNPVVQEVMRTFGATIKDIQPK